MNRFLATFTAASAGLLAWVAWRMLDEQHAERLRSVRRQSEDRLTAYRRWADWAEQDAAFRRRWAL